MPGVVRVRVRGIYATALTSLALEEGFLVVQASKPIRDRFGLPENSAPANVTLKSDERRPDELLVIGAPEPTDSVLEALRRRLPYALFRVSPIDLYSTVGFRVVEKTGERCLVELPGGVEGVFEPCRLGVDEVGVGMVTGAPVVKGERARVAPRVGLVGSYMILSRGGGRVTFSEHIRSPERRAALLAISSKYTRRGFSIHWRSNAGVGDLSEAEEEAGRLAERLEELASELEQPEVKVYSEGERIALVGLPQPAKNVLDELRSRHAPTMPGHHEYKAGGGELAILVDFGERLVARGVSPNVVSETIREHVFEALSRQRRVGIIHYKAWGGYLRLTPGRVESVVPTSSGYRVTLRRVMRGGGEYDGLGVEKNPGDYDLMVVETGSWHIVHRYHDAEGNLKGEYININTPPEFTPDSLKYYDLLVDVVRRPDGTVEVIDLDELEEARRDGVVPEPLYERALREVELLTGRKP